MVDYRKLQKSRKKLFTDLKKPLQHAKKELNDLAREVARVLSRKKAVPDADDLKRIVDMYSEIETALVISLNIIKKGYEM